MTRSSRPIWKSPSPFARITSLRRSPAIVRVFQLLCGIALLLGSGIANAGSFTNPVADAFDPHVVTYNGSYYLTGTSYTTGVYIQKSATLAALRSAPKTYVYTFGATGPAFAESPTIAYLQGRWYLYFGGKDRQSGAYGNYALEGTTADPIGPYVFKSRLRSAAEAFTILGPSVLQMPNGQLYLCSTTFGLYIQRMSNPWTVTGSLVTIRNGYDDTTYAWEGGTWEASSPFVRTANGRTTVTIPFTTENHIISASDGPDGWSWAIGGMVNTDGNILNPSSWSKLSTPLMHGGPDSGLYRMLAVSHFKSPRNNQDWIVFNAGDNLHNDFNYRKTFVQRFTWNADGTPKFGTPYNLISSYATPSGEAGSPSALTPGTVLLNDSFSSGSGNWTVVNGSWSVSGGEYQASSASENIATTGELRWADYALQASAVATVAPNNSDFDLLARMVDNTHFYQLAFYTTGGGGREWRINKNVGGAYTTLKSGPLSWNVNARYWLRFDVTEQTLTALYSVDGVNYQMLGSVNDNTYTYGKAGLRMWGGAVGRYDNVLIKQNRPSWGGFYGGPSTKGFAIAAGSTTPEGEFVPGRVGEFDPLSIGGKLDSTTATIDTSGVTDPAPAGVYGTQRYSDTRMYYDFPSFEPSKEYLVRLHFAEIHYSTPGRRSFHVTLNGTQVLTNYDPLADAGGPNKAVIKEYVVKADAFGHILVGLLHGTIADGNPIINGIEVRPISMWLSDDFSGGALSGWTSVSGTWTNASAVAQGRTSAGADGFLMRANTGTNFTYEANIRLQTAGAAGALVFRSNANASNAYAVNLDSSGQFIKLFKFPYVLLATANRTLTTGTWYHLRVNVSGNVITVYIDNKAAPVIVYTDGAYGAGRFGINAWNGTVHIDNVKAWSKP